MEGRRVRRWRSSQSQTLLPMRSNRLSNSISCWYCDYKSFVFNEPLFRFGLSYSRWLKAWFSMGVGFSLFILAAVTMILLYEIGQILLLYYGDTEMSNVLSGYLFGFSPMVYFLDGEAILEVILHNFRFLSSRKRRSILRYFLLGGTVASILIFARVLFFVLL